MAASTSASHGYVVMIPNKFTPTRHFYFQSAHLDQLGTTFIQAKSSGVTNVAGYNPLHLMYCTDPAFCYIRMEGQMGEVYGKH